MAVRNTPGFGDYDAGLSTTAAMMRAAGRIIAVALHAIMVRIHAFIDMILHDPSQRRCHYHPYSLHLYIAQTEQFYGWTQGLKDADPGFTINKR